MEISPEVGMIITFIIGLLIGNLIGMREK